MAKLSQFKNQENKGQKMAPGQDFQDKFNQYKDMSEGELNSTLFKEVARQKGEGTFDYNALAGMVESLKNALPPQDYNNIKRLLESLK